MKILKPGPRPFFVLGTMSIIAVLTPLILILPTGDWREATKIAGFMLFFPIMMLGPFIFFRIEIDEEEIRVWNFGSIKKRARFEDIGHSFPSVLAERDWPVTLTLVGKDGNTVIMELGLKILRKEDVTFLLAQPNLNIRK